MIELVSAALLLLAQSSSATPVPNPRDVGMPIGSGSKRPTVTLTAPRGGWTVDRMMLVEGRVSDPTVDPVVLSINGARYLLRTSNGSFSRKFPAASGKNVVTVLATNHGGTGSAQAVSYAQIPPVALKAILTSDTDGVYTDLHIYEPTKDSTKNGVLDPSKMAHVFWENTESPSGGTFFLNEQNGDFDQPGYGPYLYIHRAPPTGVFLIATNYWPSGDKAHTLANLDLTLFEGTPNEMHRTVRVPLATPGTTQPLAWVNVQGDGRAQIWVPSQDPPPAGDGWPSNLATAMETLKKSGATGDYDGGGGDYGGGGDEGD